MTDKKPVTQSIPFRLTIAFVVGSLVGAASAVQFIPNYQMTGEEGQVGVIGDAGGEVLTDASGSVSGGKVKGGKSSVAGGTAAAGGGTVAAGGLPPAREGLTCSRDGNGGSTDKGVTASSINMATTVAESGFAAAFLGEVRFGMDAVVDGINRAGGICGRQLAIEYRDDAWDAARGAQYLRNFIQQGVFAIPVGPSSEGLRVLIDSGDLDATKTPVVGTDGMLINQYQTPAGGAQPWVWPVAAATVSSAQVMCREAYKRGARDFSIVFDKNYKFGVEGAEAFNSCVKSVTGKDIPGYNKEYNCNDQFCGIIAAKSSYSQEAAQFQEGDFVALFVEPQTAEKWMADPNTSAASAVKYGYGGAQPLLTRAFAVNCQAKCHGLQIWTGFKPPIESYANEAPVKRYVQELKQTKPDADEFNAFTEGGYVGMLLFEEALKKVGPDLTRERLKAALDQTCLRSGLTIQDKICYGPSTRFANLTMQGFQIQYRGTFAGWRAGPIVKDTSR